MPKISVNILTKNRAALLEQALVSVLNQNFVDYEVVVVNDGSNDETPSIIKKFSADGGFASGGKNAKIKDLHIIHHQKFLGITQSRQEALLASSGEYIAILDDDDEWVDKDKLTKQADFLDQHQNYILVGGGIVTVSKIQNHQFKMRPEIDEQIRRTMLFYNNFFTSTVMFRREAALKAGGFIKDQDDFAEDYDLWLRMGKLGKMYNFQEVFTKYRLPDYNKEKFKAFLQKQLRLIGRHQQDYPGYWLASTVLKLRTVFSFK